MWLQRRVSIEYAKSNMPLTEYPRTGHPLAPAVLSPFLNRRIPKSRLRYADLDQTAWKRFQPLECFELGKQVVTQLMPQWDEVKSAVASLPLWPMEVPIAIDQIELETRTFCLMIEILSSAKEVSRLKIGDLLKMDGCGAKSLVDWLSTMDYQSHIHGNTNLKNGSTPPPASDGFGIRAAILDALRSGNQIEKCYKFVQFPTPPENCSLQDLGLENRTFNCLQEAGYEMDLAKIGKLTLEKAFQLAKFGRRCAVDLFESIERASERGLPLVRSNSRDPYYLVLEQLSPSQFEPVPEWIESLKLPRLPLMVSINDLQLTERRTMAFQQLGWQGHLEKLSEMTFGQILKLPPFSKLSVRRLLMRMLSLRGDHNFVDPDTETLTEECKTLIDKILLTEGIDTVDRFDPRLGNALLFLFHSLERFIDLRNFREHPLLFACKDSLVSILGRLEELSRRSIEAEFLEIFSQGRKSERTAQILEKRFGLMGSDRNLHATLATEHGVRSQRIQQICHLKNASLSRPYAPAMDRAIKLIQDALPLRWSKIRGLLVANKLFHPKGSLNSIKAISPLLGRSLDMEPLDNSLDCYFVSASQLEYLETIRKRAVKVACKHDSIDIASFVTECALKFEKHISTDLIEATLLSISRMQWIKCPSGWYGLRISQRQALESRIQKTLRCCHKMEITRLRNALLRDTQDSSLVPNTEVLTEICRTMPKARVRNGIVSATIKEELGKVFRGAELQIVEFLLMENEAAIEFAAIESHAKKCRIGKASLWSVLMNSPGIERVGESKYGLVGSKIK